MAARLLRLLRLLLGGLGLWLALLLSPAHAEVFELHEANSMIVLDGTPAFGTSTLPYNWDHLHKAQGGSAVFETFFNLPGEPAEPYAAYFARVGNAYEIWLNGSLLSHAGDLKRSDGNDYAKAPRYFPIPPQLLQKDNLLRIVIRTDGGRRGGVSVPVLGPENEVRALYVEAYRWRLAGSLVVSIFSLLAGTTALVLWLTQPRQDGAAGTYSRDPIYLFAGLAELGWALRVGDAVIEQPVLPWPWWGIVVAAAYAGWISGMTLFCHQVAGMQSRASNRLLGTVFVSGVACSAWALLAATPMVWTLWLGCAALAFVAYGVYYSAQALRQPEPSRIMVSIAVMTNVLAGLHDWLIVRMAGNYYADGAWIPYTSVLFGLTLGYVVVTRFRSATAQARDLMTTLSERVAQKERELQESYQRLELQARDQERAAERARILRDMHDGVGSHISSAIRQLQSGRASNADVLLTLRDSLDQLKLSIDSMNLPRGDVTALLANMRYRLEPRFAASDIELQWDVDLLPVLDRLDSHAIRQLQYMLFEALSNVLQHAQARVLRLEARAELPAVPGGMQAVRVRVVDDGRGFDVQSVRSKGLASMHERASAIGAVLRLSSQPGRTVVEIQLR